MYSNCGNALMGDLNRLKTSSTSQSFKLKQLVNFPTRGERTLDVILTNIPQFNNIPEKLAPFGLSDYFTISLFPKVRHFNKNKPRVVNYETRDRVIEWYLEESSRQLIGHVWILLTLVRKS